MFGTRTLFAFFFLLAVLHSNSQPVSLNRIDSLSGSLIAKIRSLKKEQSYITTDKSIYIAGEPVWFRVFLLNRASQKVSMQSQTVFVELVNDKNRVLNQLLLRGELHGLNGKCPLPDSLPTGYYWLRAFTKNMQLQDTASFTGQPVYVYNQNKKTEKIKKAATSSTDDIPDVNIYPEGGIMITGAPSVVALRITGKDEKPVSDSGKIKDSRDFLTTTFITDKYGLARVQLEPLRHMKYAASLNYNGKIYSYPLPPFNFFAAQVAVLSQKDGSKKIRVLLEDSIYSTDFETYLVAVSKDSLCFASIGSGNYELTIPPNKFPPGIATFFLFDENLKLLSERSVYINEGLTVKAEMNKTVYSKREQAIIHISFSDAAGLPVVASCSISATEDHFTKHLEKDGKCPGDWALSEDNDLTDEETDLLMLTKNNAYRNIMNNASATTPVTGSDSLLYIHGTLKDKNDNPLQGKVISLFSKTGSNFFQTDTTDAHGRFNFPLTNYADSTLFTLQALDNAGKPESWKADLDTFKFRSLPITSMHRRKFNMQPDNIARYVDSSFFEKGKVLLQPVEVKNSLAGEPGYDKSKRVSRFSHIVAGKDIENSGNRPVGDAVLSTSGLKLLNGFLVSGGPSKLTGVDATSEPIVVVDGVTVALSSDVTGTSPVLNYLNSLNSHSIDFIEILTGPEASAYGIRGGMGVILVNTTGTYRQNDVGGKSNTLKNFYAKGYMEPPLFTMPSYDTKKQDIPANTDLRTTIYWNGNVLTDKDGKAMISFYTNDVPGNYTVTIRGITAHGYVIYKTVPYELK